jgi:quinoprotein glucose dehydrogenase
MRRFQAILAVVVLVVAVHLSRDTISYVFNPIVVDNVVYVLARNNSLVALDAATGKEIWIRENRRGIAPHGINHWESKDRSDRRLLLLQMLPEAAAK